MFICRILILFVESVIEPADDLACLHGDLHLLGEGCMLFLYKEFHPIGGILQGLQPDDFRILSGLVLVVDTKLLKIACDDITRHLIQRHVIGVSLRLLIRSEHDAAGLRFRLREVMRHAFLLDHDPCLRKIHIYVLLLSVHDNAALELYVFLDALHAINILQE